MSSFIIRKRGIATQSVQSGCDAYNTIKKAHLNKEKIGNRGFCFPAKVGKIKYVKIGHRVAPKTCSCLKSHMFLAGMYCDFRTSQTLYGRLRSTLSDLAYFNKSGSVKLNNALRLLRTLPRFQGLISRIWLLRGCRL